MTVFLDASPVIYLIEQPDTFGPDEGDWRGVDDALQGELDLLPQLVVDGLKGIDLGPARRL
jgi:hypothetical protein